MPSVHRIVLYGSDHTELDQPAVEAVGPIAIGISRGRHPKAYGYVDPNEDAVLAASTGSSHLLAVADGHNSVMASHAVIERLAKGAEILLSDDPTVSVERAGRMASEALTELVWAEERPQPATTLAAVVVGNQRAAYLSWGDSAVVRLRGRGAKLLPPNGPFLVVGTPLGVLRSGSFRLRPGDRLMVATDGLTDFLPQPWHRSLARMAADCPDPSALIKKAIRTAGQGGGGDNISAATLDIAGEA